MGKRSEVDQIVEVDHVLVNHGYERELTFLKESSLALSMTEHQKISADGSGQTNVPGLFAAGDCLAQQGKLHLLAGAFQDAANAVNAVKTYLDPTAHASGKVSSHNEVFAEKNKQMKEAAM